MRTFLAILAATSVAAAAIVATGATAAPGKKFPEVISLPNGWQPEGIAIGKGTTFYSGSRVNGAIYRGDVRTGTGSIWVAGPTGGGVAVGLALDHNAKHLFVAGAGSGKGTVYDTRSRNVAASYTLTAPGTFVNDVIVTRTAAYFTQSSLAEFYRVPLGKGGKVDPAATPVKVALGGEWQQGPGFNANGIEATPNGRWLIIVNSSTGFLYRVDPATGNATKIDLGGATMTTGDGLLLQGSTLYVVRNTMNQIAVVKLSHDLLHGSVTGTITSPSLFDVPTTIARFGNSLYAINARFTTPATPSTTYTLVKVKR